jgi:hypothetical protein
MKRADEELCRAVFDLFVQRFFARNEVVWTEVAQEEEPPDYYLSLRNAKFAVEVTTLMEKIPVGTLTPLPRGVIRAILHQFVREVDSIARTEGQLQGNYLVSFPKPIDDFAGVQDGMRERLLEYIRRTANVETAPEEIVYERRSPRQRPQRCEIQKLNNERKQVLMGGPIWSKWEGEIAQDACWLLSNSLDTKTRKLEAIREPWILLLLDRYAFASQRVYEECVSQLPAMSYFHTVFVVQHEERAFILHCRNSSWLEA